MREWDQETLSKAPPVAEEGRESATYPPSVAGRIRQRPASAAVERRGIWEGGREGESEPTKITEPGWEREREEERWEEREEEVRDPVAMGAGVQEVGFGRVERRSRSFGSDSAGANRTNLLSTPGADPRACRESRSMASARAVVLEGERDFWSLVLEEGEGVLQTRMRVQDVAVAVAVSGIILCPGVCWKTR